MKATLRNLLAYRASIAFVVFFVALYFTLVPDAEGLNLFVWVASGDAGGIAASRLALFQAIVTIGMCKFWSFIDGSPARNKRAILIAMASFTAYAVALGIGGYLQGGVVTFAFLFCIGGAIVLAMPLLTSSERANPRGQA